MKIKTLSQLQDSLDKEMGWRIKEIIYLKSNVKSKNSVVQPTLIRAGTALLYAHWEGFVKQSSINYIEYINSQRIIYSNLKTPLIVMGLKNHLDKLKESGNFLDNSVSLEFIRSNMIERFGINSSNAINTYSNLNSKVFSNIATSLCLPLSQYEAKFNFMDESLLKRRNKVAHGEFLDITNDDWRTLADEVLALLRTYKNDLENAASLATYKIS